MSAPPKSAPSLPQCSMGIIGLGRWTTLIVRQGKLDEKFKKIKLVSLLSTRSAQQSGDVYINNVGETKNCQDYFDNTDGLRRNQQ